jgi:hypothetical protein
MTMWIIASVWFVVSVIVGVLVGNWLKGRL